MTSYNDLRIRQANDRPVMGERGYVLYWMQAYRRLDHNHALDRAVHWATQLDRPLAVYEGLRLDYPWASARMHQFILEGMQANAAQANKLGLNYWPYVETPDQPARGLLRRLAKHACVIVTDDYPCFIMPGQTAALAAKADVCVEAVDGNSIVPLAELGDATPSAAVLRRRIHKTFAAAWPHHAAKTHCYSKKLTQQVAPPFDVWKAKDVRNFVAKLPFQDAVPPVPGVTGGAPAARAVLRRFIRQRLAGYAELRSPPAPRAEAHASGLSPYLHFGHISIEEVVAAVLETVEGWSLDSLHAKARGKREGFYCSDADVNAFLDEAITWRDVGLNWHWQRRTDTASLQEALPTWAWQTLQKHADDKREHVYTLEEWEKGETHDELWNAAQRELVATGQIHNYLRMVWGKKVLEWSASPDEAYRILVHLNNKYAIDGRDPNSYSGILWCFGLFDRPWGPERPVFGKVRYMSCANTARKFDLEAYFDYVARLPTIAAVRG